MDLQNWQRGRRATDLQGVRKRRARGCAVELVLVLADWWCALACLFSACIFSLVRQEATFSPQPTARRIAGRSGSHRTSWCGRSEAEHPARFVSCVYIGTFVRDAGQKGVQRTILPPGTVAPIHPVGFLVITKNRVYGIPVADEYARLARTQGGLGPQSFGLTPEQLDVVPAVCLRASSRFRSCR
jgi:hypothetical protein